jgi:hypothetical protein
MRLRRLVERCYDDVRGTWEERFETLYGPLRGFVDDVVFAFTDCGSRGTGALGVA